MIKNWFKNIGPGPLVAAAFIGPGTVTVCTLAGANFGYALLWAMLLSIIATIILQEMAARLGIISQKGLAETIRTEIRHPVIRNLAILLVFSAIVVGSAAYEAGNITGGVLGVETVIQNAKIQIAGLEINLFSILIGLITFTLLFIGKYKVLEKVLISLVILMSLAFLLTAIITEPNIFEILKGVLIPSFPKDGLLTIIALVGTTVVPYNLFLHASLVSEKWKSPTDLKFARKDTMIAIILGGLVSMCIIISASAINTQEISSATDLAKGLEPLFGRFAKYFMAVGLLSAGITSAITAPLAAAYVVCGCFGWSSNMKTKTFKSIWMTILLLGVIFSSLGIKPIDIIKFAQVTNGILLPIIVGFLVWVVNKPSVLGIFKNTLTQNIVAFIILLISILLSMATLSKAFSLNIF